jgi:hypothetical protein
MGLPRRHHLFRQGEIKDLLCLIWSRHPKTS